MKENHFLYASTILFGLMTQSAWCMEYDPDKLAIVAAKPAESSIEEKPESEHALTSGRIGLSDLPLEILAHILSFLYHQKYLFVVQLISKDFLTATKRAWENTPLNLSFKKLSPKEYKALAQGPFSKLILINIGLGIEGIQILALSSKFTHLDLGFNRSGPEGAEAIAGVNLLKLVDLNLSNNNIGVKGTKAIAAANFPLLTTLSLSTNSIGDEGAKELTAAHFPLLTTLDLSINRIGDVGAKELTAAHFPLLTTLDLSINRIGDEGAKEIAKAIADGNFPLLTAIHLRNNRIGYEGKKAFATNAHLNVIY